MTAPQAIRDLVDRFKLHEQAYKRSSYNETQVRREFVDPFFKALGWDIDNEQGYAEAYKDVVHEDAMKVGGKTTAPDYAFRVGGTRKFFLEATLLHKSAAEWTSPFPGQSYPATSVMGVPSAVNPFSTATRTWNSAT